MNKRYHIIKNLDYCIIDKKTDNRMSFEIKEVKWKQALIDMAKYIRKKKIGFREIYLTPSLSSYDKKTLLGKIK